MKLIQICGFQAGSWKEIKEKVSNHYYDCAPEEIPATKYDNEFFVFTEANDYRFSSDDEENPRRRKRVDAIISCITDIADESARQNRIDTMFEREHREDINLMFRGC